MISAEQTGCAAYSQITEEELPVRANLKVIRRNDPNHGLTEDEIQDRNEFIRCHVLKDLELLLMIPKQDPENDFFIHDFQESAFNTHDFQRKLEPFNKYAYRIKKVMEKVMDLAIMHSAISSKEGRENTLKTYEALVENEFRDRLLTLAGRHKWAKDEEKRSWLKNEIAKLNRRILECKKVWESYAPPENWDS
jgi:hypothetical protein